MAAVPILFTLTAEHGFTFQSSLFEDGFHLSKGALYNGTNIIGRSSPIITYSNSDSMTLEVTLQLVSLSRAEGGAIHDIRDCVSSFLSLTFPMHPGVTTPPLCTISLGNLLTDWECVAENVSPHYAAHNLYDSDGTPMTASVEVHFKGIEIQSRPASAWLKAGIYRQLAFRQA